MSSTMLGYSKINSPIHNLTGATKLICFILWTLASMVTYDTRVLIFMTIFSLIVFKISKVEFKSIALVLYFILIFLLLNNLAIYIFSPYEGVNIYGSRSDLFALVGPYTVTVEQLFYQFNITLKYFTVIPMALLFIVATDPSEFAASLNKLGVNYRIAYSVSLALRYIPDIQRDYQDISFAQQSRGIDMSRKEKLLTRLKNAVSILMPLIFSSLDRIEIISCAMELRSFGKNKKRTWYKSRPFLKSDYIAIFIIIGVLLISIGFLIINKGRFYNPFL